MSAFLPAQLRLAPEDAHVVWMDMGGVELSDPFFHRTVARCRGTVPEVVTGLDEFPPGTATLPVTCFIAHMGRCGSTLLANMLRHLDLQVVSEPQPLTASLAPYSRGLWPVQRDTWERTRNRLVSRIVDAYRRETVKGRRGLVVKLTSWTTTRIGVLRALWPTIPIIFVARDPVEVLVSFITGPPGWFNVRRSGRRARKIFGWEADSSAMTAEEFGARALGVMCQTALAFREHLTVVPYETLRSESLCHIAQRCGLERPTREMMSRVESSMGIYSKRSDGTRFVPDGARKRATASPAIREAVERWAMPLYEQVVALAEENARV